MGPAESARIARRVDDRAAGIALALGSEDDDEAAETVSDVLNALWGRCDPDPDWWRTPVGRLCARSLGHSDSDAVTHSVAAAMLGIGRNQIGVLVNRGKLERHPDGGVTRASVLLRIADR